MNSIKKMLLVVLAAMMMFSAVPAMAATSPNNDTPSKEEELKTPEIKIENKAKQTKKAKKLKKKARKIQLNVNTTSKGKMTFSKKSGSKKIKVSEDGTITVKKGTKKGTYKVTVKVAVEADGTYGAGFVEKVFTIKVK